MEILLRRLLPCVVALAFQIGLHGTATSLKNCIVSIFLCYFEISFYGLLFYNCFPKLRVKSQRAHIAIGTALVWFTFYGLSVVRQVNHHTQLSLEQLVFPLIVPTLVVCSIDTLIKLQDGNKTVMTLFTEYRRDKTVTRFVGAASNRFLNLLAIVFLPSLIILKCVSVYGHIDEKGHWIYVVAVPMMIFATYFVLKMLMGKRKIAQMQDEVVTLPEDYYRSEFL